MNPLPEPAQNQNQSQNRIPPSTTSPGASTPAPRPRAALGTALVAALLGLALTAAMAPPASAGLVHHGATTGVSGVSGQTGGLLGAGRARYRGATFQLATFNILGSNHTRNSRRYARGTSRARTTATMIKGRGTDVINLQEVQTDQLRVLSRKLRGHGIWPRHRLGNQGVRLQVAWRKNRFKHVSHGHINTWFHRQVRPIPWVQLKDRRSGAKFYVINIHNSPGRQERARDKATRKEIRLVKRLRRTGKPVFIGGDANEHYEFFCKVGRATSLVAPNGGNPDARPCRKPNGRLIIDWIMGGGRIDFRHYTQRRGNRVRRASDHHYVQTTVRVAHKVR